MSMALGHFAVGAAATGILVLLFLPRFRYARTLVLAGGVWAMIPDAYHVVPAYTGSLRRLHDSALMNVFWGHHYLDVVDPGDTAEFAAVGLLAMFGVFLLVEVRAARPLPTVVSELRGGAVVPTRPWLWIRRLLAGTALLAGGTVVAVALVRVRFVGLLVAAGAILGLVGLELLVEDPHLRTAASRQVPGPVRTGVKLVISLLAATVVGGLLSTLPEFSELTLSYAALALVVVVLVVRLWTPILPAPTSNRRDGDDGDAVVPEPTEAEEQLSD